MKVCVSFTFALLFIFSSLYCPAAHGDGANDAAVERLRAALAARGIYTPVDPPKELGVHSACIRHGRSCPDAYVKFLETQVDIAGGIPPPPPPGRGRERGRGAAGARAAADPSAEADAEADAESQLTNIRHLRNVLRDQLAEHTSSASMAHCSEVRWLHIGLRVALAVHNGIVQPYWDFAVCRLLPCSVLIALCVWIFWGDRIPLEHLRCILASDPTFLVNERRPKRSQSTSVAELVIERERFNRIGGSANVDPRAASSSSLFDLEADAHRRNRWSLTRFALLEVYGKARPSIVVLKLRFVLSLAVFLMLFWTLVALPMRAADIKNNQEGLFTNLFAALLPSWMGATALLYLGWSWIGTMVAYAGWEVLAAVDALMHSEDRAAAMHEQILQKWND